MSRRARWLPAAGLFFFFILVSVVIGGGAPALPSMYSRAPEGLSVMAQYLEARDRPVSAVDQEDPAADDPGEGVLVVALPSARSWTVEQATRLGTWVRRGGHLVLLTPTDTPLPPALEAALNVTVIPLGATSEPDWQTWQTDWERASNLKSEVGELVVKPSGTLVTCRSAAGARVHDGDDRVVVCEQAEGRGVLTVVNNVTLFQNSTLGIAHNLDFLEALFPVGAPVRFWEHHHNLAVTPTGDTPPIRLELILAQMILIYLLIMHQRASALGPPRPALTDREPGLVTELRTLGLLHAAGKHGIEAGRRVLDLARRRRAGDERVEALPTTIHTLPEALSVARQIAEIERSSV